MRYRVPDLALAFLLALGCGATRKDDKKPFSTADGGAAGMPSQVAGMSSQEDDPCDAPSAFPIWGKPYDAERDCIDTENPVEGVACTIQPQEGDDPYYSDGFTCLQSKASGERVWVFAFNRVGFKASVWERCPDVPLISIAPKGCYAAECPTAPRSTCSLAETRRMYGCGPTSEYDENCCGRPACETDEDCADNEACVEFTTLGQLYCWDNPGNTCDCGGPRGGAPRPKCIAK
jgi:hypothetical protein